MATIRFPTLGLSNGKIEKIEWGLSCEGAAEDRRTTINREIGRQSVLSVDILPTLNTARSPRKRWRFGRRMAERPRKQADAADHGAAVRVLLPRATNVGGASTSS